MTGLTLLLLIGAILAAVAFHRRLRRVERELADLCSALAGGTAPAARAPAPPRISRPRPAPTRRLPRPKLNFETLVGGRLPIWIGGAALALAGFYLVRLSIESGLLGPVARTILAALFAALLIAASEAAHRLSAALADRRVGQALAGAGVASGYATLYMAAALYDLVAPLPAFVAMLGITALALALALRHGPPTAAMALAGGFLAPLVAGFEAAGVGPLLVYLALFIAALFGLGVRRGWAWLAIAAAAAGFAWINFLINALQDDDLAALGLFTVVLAAGASAALPAAGARARWLRLVPLLAGLVQLVALAPALEFDAPAWSFYLVLAAASLVLAWRDRIYLPGAAAALALLLLLEAVAMREGATGATLIAALVATLLFALPGHLRVDRPGWALLALGGTAGPLLVAHAAAAPLLAPAGWAAAEIVAAALCAWIVWRTRDTADPLARVAAPALVALLATLAIATLLPPSWLAVPLALAMLALAGWAHRNPAPALFALPALPFAAAVLAAVGPLGELGNALVQSVGGARLPYPLLPDLGLLLRALALPTVAAALLLADPRQFGRGRRAAGIAAIALAILLLYALAKQPLAIATDADFRSWGFVERALLTHACLAAGWLLYRRTRLRGVATALLALGFTRFVWFDLLVLNPVWVAQAVGSFPLLNAAVLHTALTAFWLWMLPPRPFLRTAAGVATLVSVLAAVRQATHGTILTGPVTTLENTGYSAALLILALFWLWRGIAIGARDLRLFGLVLLTGVTFKVFLVDAAALDGVLRILSFLGLGVALIGIGWAYGRFLGREAQPGTDHPSP
ncbi:DUF2339 domain-containing protein [Sphingosinithalassobacter sp. CS137]|uniref:DUF2339 domain-containing protein n=1 Tax=Sphingosinithalassobacter sp. CS137 TaxID=2762748 RepID=UPI0021D17E10|nr:DUF2339 domain-containing protein [Sphingosinithalassobacter sp. CS137]